MDELFVCVFYQDTNKQKKDILLPVEDVDRFGVEQVFESHTGLESSHITDYNEHIVVNAQRYFRKYIMDSWGRYKVIDEI